MISNLRHSVKLGHMCNGLIPTLVLIACTVLIVPTAHAGFFDQLKQATQAVQKIQHDLSGQPASQPAPAIQQPGSTPFARTLPRRGWTSPGAVNTPPL